MILEPNERKFICRILLVYPMSLRCESTNANLALYPFFVVVDDHFSNNYALRVCYGWENSAY